LQSIAVLFVKLLTVLFNWRMKTKRELTDEQKADARRLRAIWDARWAGVISQEEAAHRCGWKTQGAFNQYLNGVVPLNLEALIKICRVLEIESLAEVSPTLAKELSPEPRFSIFEQLDRLAIEKGESPPGHGLEVNESGKAYGRDLFDEDLPAEDSALEFAEDRYAEEREASPEWQSYKTASRLKEISRLALTGRLTDDDVKLLEELAKRIAR